MSTIKPSPTTTLQSPDQNNPDNNKKLHTNLDNEKPDIDPEKILDNKTPGNKKPDNKSPDDNPDEISEQKLVDQRGVKDDLSDLKNTLTRNFWGVASFLAPPPQSWDIKNGEINNEEEEDVAGIDGAKGDLAEIGGKVRTGISRISDNIKVPDFGKIASSFLQLGASTEESVNYDGNAIGVNEEVVAFVRYISTHHETWLNFPLPDDEEEEDDEFDLSDAQQEHALAVERLAPGLADLRFALCPSYMSEGCFWKIYFVLLHTKLDKNDALVLSTPQILKARAFLTTELRNKPKARANQDFTEKVTTENENIVLSKPPSEPTPLDTPTVVPVTSNVARGNQDFSEKVTTENEISVPSKTPSKPSPLATPTVVPVKPTVDIEIEKHPIQSSQVPIIDKSVVDKRTISSAKDQPSDSSSSSKDKSVVDKGVTSSAKDQPSDSSSSSKDKSVVDKGTISSAKDHPSGSSSSSKVLIERYDDDGDDWLKEEGSELAGVMKTAVHIADDEDVSFSDLEED